uniref:Uncharacterized protein n=1 Tax=Rhizophora mucronata TaxID=61149 RepID=A0A2P2K868_RHIMU
MSGLNPRSKSISNISLALSTCPPLQCLFIRVLKVTRLGVIPLCSISLKTVIAFSIIFALQKQSITMLQENTFARSPSFNI